MVRVTVLIALVAPTTTFPKLTEVGDADVCAIPVAVSGRLCGEFEAFVVIVSELAGTAPTAVGVTVMEITQLAPAASELPQVFEAIAYSAGGVTAEIVRGEVWLLVSVTDLSALVVPTGTLPKAREVAESEVGATPAALNGTDTGLFDALLVIVRVPAGVAPGAVGVTLTRI